MLFSQSPNGVSDITTWPTTTTARAMSTRLKLDTPNALPAIDPNPNCRGGLTLLGLMYCWLCTSSAMPRNPQ
jgi:hypothetical protein